MLVVWSAADFLEDAKHVPGEPRCGAKAAEEIKRDGTRRIVFWSLQHSVDSDGGHIVSNVADGLEGVRIRCGGSIAGGLIGGEKAGHAVKAGMSTGMAKDQYARRRGRCATTNTRVLAA